MLPAYPSIPIEILKSLRKCFCNHPKFSKAPFYSATWPICLRVNKRLFCSATKKWPVFVQCVIDRTNFRDLQGDAVNKSNKMIAEWSSNWLDTFDRKILPFTFRLAKIVEGPEADKHPMCFQNVCLNIVTNRSKLKIHATTMNEVILSQHRIKEKL